MNNYTVIETSSWNRKTTFDFFQTFEIPFYNITANLDVTNLKKYCDNNGISFFLVCLFLSQKVISQTENFRYRLANKEVRKYDKTQAGSTILLDNKTFAFCYFPIESNLIQFVKQGENAIKNFKANPDFEPREGDLNMVFYSVIPWISFTSFQHARRFEENDSIPRIVFGKYFEQNNTLQMPISIEVHHSLVDGYHVGQYFELFQKEIDSL
jgi:chloramphenicol O-acetyltransferase type A